MRDYRRPTRWERQEAARQFRIAMTLCTVFAVILCAGCATTRGPAFDWRDVPGHDPDYNAAGGYADACGELPGMIGDDC